MGGSCSFLNLPLNMWGDKYICLIQTNSYNSNEHANIAYRRDKHEGIKETHLLKAGESLAARDDLHVNSAFFDPATNQNPEKDCCKPFPLCVYVDWVLD